MPILYSFDSWLAIGEEPKKKTKMKKRDGWS